MGRFDPGGVTVGIGAPVVNIGFSDSFYLELDVVGSNFTGRVYDHLGGTLLHSISATDSSYASGFSGVAVGAQGNLLNEALLGEFDTVASKAVPEPSSLVLLGIAAR